MQAGSCRSLLLPITGLAMHASRSLIALLVGTVVFFALWVIALKPSSSSSGGGSSKSQSLGAYSSDINAAKKAVATSAANDAASGNENATSGGASSAGTSAKTSSKASKTSATASASKHAEASRTKQADASKSKAAAKSSTRAASHSQPSVASEVSTVKTAVTDHKVVALLFYNPAGSDDQAVKQELSAVPTHKGQVVKLAVPLNQSGNFTAVTAQVPVNLSPTLVVISRSGDADELVGYTAPFVIDQEVANALATS